MEGRVLPVEEIRIIFERFAEGNPYYIPLLLSYYCGFSADEAFGLTFECVQPGTVISGFGVKYNRSDNELYFTPSPFRKVVVNRDVEMALRRAINRNLCASGMKYRPVYHIDEKGRLNVKSGMPVSLVNLRPDGTFVSPLGINHVARVIHGKKGNFSYPDPKWRIEDMIASGEYYNIRVNN